MKSKTILILSISLMTMLSIAQLRDDPYSWSNSAWRRGVDRRNTLTTSVDISHPAPIQIAGDNSQYYNDVAKWKQQQKQQVNEDSREPEEVWAVNALKTLGENNPSREMINLMIRNRLKEICSVRRFQLMSEVYSEPYTKSINELTLEKNKLQARVKLLEENPTFLSTEISEQNALLKAQTDKLEDENRELKARIRVLMGTGPTRIEVKPARRYNDMISIGGGI